MEVQTTRINYKSVAVGGEGECRALVVVPEGGSSTGMVVHEQCTDMVMVQNRSAGKRQVMHGGEKWGHIDKKQVLEYEVLEYEAARRWVAERGSMPVFDRDLCVHILDGKIVKYWNC